MRSANIAERERAVVGGAGLDGDVAAGDEDHCHHEEDQGHQEQHHQKYGLCLHVIYESRHFTVQKEKHVLLFI